MGRNRRKKIGSVFYDIGSLRAAEVTKELGDWSTYPRGADRMFDDGIDTLTAVAESDPAWQDYFRDQLDLDPTNPEHIAVAAALMGLTSAYDVQLDEDEGTIASIGEDSSAQIKIYPSSDGTVSVDINTFAKLGRSRQTSLAYSMIRRMAWGMRRYAEIHGVPPSGTIYLQAESDGMAMNGVQTWAKLGFNLSTKGDLRDAIRAMGFTGSTSQEVMMERNAAGQTGFDAWDEIVQQSIDDNGGAEADGGFDIADGSTSLSILNAYAARKNY